MQSKLTTWCLIVALIFWSSNLTAQLESRVALEQLNKPLCGLLSPLVPNTSSANRARNRRVEIIII